MIDRTALVVASVLAAYVLLLIAGLFGPILLSGLC
jgi:hypothetical protein